MPDWGILNQNHDYVGNALTAFNQGRQDRAMTNAGNALAAGNQQGAATAFYRGGMVEQGQALQEQMRRQEMDRIKQERDQTLFDRQTTEFEQQQKQQALSQALKVAEGLRDLPPEGRVQIYMSQIAPALKRVGVPDDMIAEAAQNGITDEELDQFWTAMGGGQDQQQMVNLGNGGVATYGQRRGLNIVRAPERPVPMGYIRTPDGKLTYEPGGPADPHVVGQRAAAARKPAAPRVARPGPAAGGGLQYRPMGQQLDPNEGW